jgi:hypothetical protein
MEHDIFQNKYTQISLALLMALILTFAGDIKIIGEKKITILTLVILILMLMTRLKKGEIGIILLLSALLIISYNKQQFKVISSFQQ